MSEWTDAVIIRYCGGCEARTRHARRQTADSLYDWVTITTKYACTECGSIDTETQGFPRK